MAKLRGIKLLIIDMDNTLCDTFHSLTKKQWGNVERVLERAGHKEHASVFRRMLGKRSFVSTLRQLDLSRKEQAIATCAYDEVEVKGLRLYPDARSILDAGTAKVLVTRGDRELQIRKIKHLGLQKRFDGIYYVGTFNAKKDAFRKILSKFKAKPSEVLVIGDRIEEEIADANSLGIRSVLVRRPDWPVRKGAAKPTLTVRSLTTVAKMLE
jgi:HAD superfamily hydrolase (TIGR01509 family)